MKGSNNTHSHGKCWWVERKEERGGYERVYERVERVGREEGVREGL